MVTQRSRPPAATTRLAQWLHEHGQTQISLARQLGVSIATVSRVVRGVTMPQDFTTRRIERITEGQVTAADLRRDKNTNTPANRAARIRYAKDLIARGESMQRAAEEEQA